MSTGVLAKKGLAFMHDDKIMMIYQKDSKEPFIGGYVVPESSNCIPFVRILDPGTNCYKAESMELWHNRFGHVSDQCIKLMESKGLVNGLQLNGSSRDFCEGCRLGKMTVGPHPPKDRRECLPGERIHSDVCGPIVESVTGMKYFLVFKDESSGFRQVFFLKSKDQVPATIKLFLGSVERVSGRKVVSFRSDCGTEYCNQNIESWFKSSGIQHETSAPYVKQGNGIAERENRTLQDSARAMLFTMDLSVKERESLWSEAVGTAAYLRNRVPNRDDTDATPYEKFTGKKPDVSHLRVFGSPAFVRIPDANRRKFSEKSWKGIFVGYDSMTERIYRVFDPRRRKVFRVGDVIIEDGIRGSSLFPAPSNLYSDVILDPVIVDPVEELVPETCGQDLVPEEVAGDEKPSSSEEEETENDGDDDESFHSLQDVESPLKSPTPVKRKRGRPAKGTEKVKDAPVPHSMLRRNQVRPREEEEIMIASKSEKQAMMATALDPTSVNDAMSRKDGHLWKQAMDSEMKSLLDNQTWELVDLPEGRDTVSCRWIFKSKLNPDGSLERRKARLVARGFSQKPGIDYQETFASVVRYETIRVVLSLAAHHDMEMSQFDVKTAFLNGPLQETVFMEQPDGFDDKSGKVCLLRKSLYGLKQAPRNWNQTFDQFVVAEGFVSSKADPGLYFKQGDGEFMMLTLYVDDGLICSSSRKCLDEFLENLKSRFEVTVNEPSCYVGMQISRDREERRMSISQSG